MPKLGVNIDHVATLRQQRKGFEPDPVKAALIAESAGADGIVCHLREDRRHIHDIDVVRLRREIKTKLNLEMSINDEIVRIALKIKPDSVCLVPERRQELTTEGGLDVVKYKNKLSYITNQFHSKGIIVSLFIDPEPRQINMAKFVGTDFVELHTGTYAEIKNTRQKNRELKKLISAAKLVNSIGLGLNAGHGLDYQNVVPIAKISGMHELNIGYSIIVRSIFIGIDRAVKEMVSLVK